MSRVSNHRPRRSRVLAKDPRCHFCCTELHLDNSCSKWVTWKGQRRVIIYCYKCPKIYHYAVWLNGGNVGDRKKYRRFLWEEDPRCSYCREMLTLPKATLDHVIPTSQGGMTHVENLVLACERCNTKKSSQSLENFLKELPNDLFARPFSERVTGFIRRLCRAFGAIESKRPYRYGQSDLWPNWKNQVRQGKAKPTSSEQSQPINKATVAGTEATCA